MPVSSPEISAGRAREHVLRLQRAGRAEEFLVQAAAYLSACPDDELIRTLLIRRYVQLGLVEPAGELIRGAGPSTTIGRSAEWREVRDTIERLPPSQLPWSSRRNRFEANLSALSGRGVDVAAVQAAWKRAQSQFQLFADSHRRDRVRRLGAAGDWQWYPLTPDDEATASNRPLPVDIESLQPGPYLFNGIGLGYFFQRVYLRTLDTFHGYSCPIYVVEPEPELLAVALHLHDWGGLLADQRLYWFAGDGCNERLCGLLQAEPLLPWPSRAIHGGARLDSGDGAALHELIVQAGLARDEAVNRSLAELEELYAGRDVAYWAKRLTRATSGEGPPLRILGAVSIHTTFLQYSMDDCCRALENLGHACRVLREPNNHTSLTATAFHDAVRDFEPDLFFALDHIRPEFEKLLPSNLPILTFDQDYLPHVFTNANMSRIARHDFVAGYAAPALPGAGCDPRQCRHERVPTCPERFDGPPLTDGEREQYACDVSYVSHASQTPQAFHAQERAQVAHVPAVQRLLDVLYELGVSLVAVHGVLSAPLPQRLVAEAAAHCGIQALDPDLHRRLTTWYLWRLGDRIFRHEALEWVARWARANGRSFRIYGHGWQDHPTLSAFAAGPAENGRELVCIYRASRINLQLMPAGFLHQRALDGLAAGGFFLTRRVPMDFKGRALAALVRRMDQLGIHGTDPLFDDADGELREMLRAYCGPFADHLRQDPDLCRSLRLKAGLEYPDQCFDDFEAITFDSSASFAAKADHYAGRDAERQAVVARMRETVVQRFSYCATLERCLRSMASYLRRAASEAGPGV